MNPDLQTIFIEFVISPLIGAIIIWLAWLTLTVFNNKIKIGINTALDKQAQSTLTEIKDEMKSIRADMTKFNTSITKILAKLDIE